MSQMEGWTDSKNTNSSSMEIRDVFVHLQNVLIQYLEAHPNVSTAGISKRCAVSEPTLRRIRNGQTKSLPSLTTIVELLMFLSKETEVKNILSHYPGPLAEYLKDKLLQFEVKDDVVFSQDLTDCLRDPVKYLIYKMAAMKRGVRASKIVELLGSYGESQAQSLMLEGWLIPVEGVLYAKYKNFSLSHESFIEHFKATATFIKANKLPNVAKSHSPMFYNISRGINRNTYAEILKIQRMANKKILTLMDDEKNEGEVPTFFLTAIDTLDSLCADEIQES